MAQLQGEEVFRDGVSWLPRGPRPIAEAPQQEACCRPLHSLHNQNAPCRTALHQAQHPMRPTGRWNSCARCSAPGSSGQQS